MSDAATPSPNSSAASPGLVLHRVGFVTNTALQGALAGALCLVTTALLAIYLAMWLIPNRAFDLWSWALSVAIGLSLAELLGAILGGALGIWAGLRASQWAGKPLPSLRASLPGAVLTITFNVVGFPLAALLLATMAGLNDQLEAWHLLVLAVPCAFLGLVVGAYVGLADPLSLRGVRYALGGAVVGSVPAGLAALLLLQANVDRIMLRRDFMIALLLAGGSLGGWLLGHLVEMSRRDAGTPALKG